MGWGVYKWVGWLGSIYEWVGRLGELEGVRNEKENEHCYFLCEVCLFSRG